MERNNRIDGELSVCPDEQTLGAFVERTLPEAEMARVFAHVAGCAVCREDVRELAEWLGAAAVADAEGDDRHADVARRVWMRMQWRQALACFRPERRTLAAADGQSPDQMQTENAVRCGFIHFVSQTTENGWHVSLAVPSCPVPETLLRLTVSDLQGNPIPEGTLIFCGMRLQIRAGTARTTVGEFQQHMAEGMIVLRRTGMEDVPGYPVLGYDLN